jgi:hypothetical protein
MDLQPVDATPWRYVLQAAGDGQFSLVVATGSTRLSDETLQKAVNYLVTCLIGEEVRIDYVPRMRVMATFKEGQESNARPLLGLWAELSGLVTDLI